MKLDLKQKTLSNPQVDHTFKNSCLASCRKFLDRMTQTKEAIFSEFSGALAAHRHLLHLALNEAESLAWQTRYPHLVFPDLAAEKVQAVIAWDAHQKSVRRRSQETEATL